MPQHPMWECPREPSTRTATHVIVGIVVVDFRRIEPDGHDGGDQQRFTPPAMGYGDVGAAVVTGEIDAHHKEVRAAGGIECRVDPMKRLAQVQKLRNEIRSPPSEPAVQPFACPDSLLDRRSHSPSLFGTCGSEPLRGHTPAQSFRPTNARMRKRISVPFLRGAIVWPAETAQQRRSKYGLRTECGASRLDSARTHS